MLLNKAALVYDIYDLNTNERLSTGGETKSYVVLLRKAKTALQNMGVTFEEESRKDYVKNTL
jgi:hypothetical protein